MRTSVPFCTTPWNRSNAFRTIRRRRISRRHKLRLTVNPSEWIGGPAQTVTAATDRNFRVQAVQAALHEKSDDPSSLCILCVLCASVVKELFGKATTETQRTQSLHREIRSVSTFRAKPVQALACS